MTKHIAVLIVCLSSIVWADRTLSSAETTAILKTLTDNARLTWLPAGTIQASHLEYHDAEKIILESLETIQTNGTQFRWEILLSSADPSTTESIRSTYSLSGDIDVQANQHRIFGCDGTQSIRYYKSAGQAMIESSVPGPVGGPFSAGIIPWGHGFYTLTNLSRCTVSAVEQSIDGRTLIKLQISPPDTAGPFQMTFQLDPTRQYCVISFEMEDPQHSKIRQAYRNYVQVNQKWIPTIITIERFLKQPYGLQLSSYDDWKLDLITPEIPDSNALNIEFDMGTLVEIRPSQTSRTILYHAADKTKTNELLAEKISLLVQPAIEHPNCATTAASFVAKKFSRSVPTEQLNLMASSDNQKTSLFQLKQTLEEAGLSCLAVETDLETLRQAHHCQAVLHLPVSSHYIILDHIDDQYVWSIDLTNRKFYYRTAISEFKKQWTTGTALLVSDQPQNLPAQQVSPISLTTQQQIFGGDPAGYSCTDLLQVDSRIECPPPVGILCGGAHYIIYERMGCQEDPNGGQCYGTQQIGYSYAHCINNPSNPTVCSSNGLFYNRYIRACQ
ncbi:MAG: hypothetical protein JXB18_07410 [Sedimentisphaerales bacterium]|nr:hypothetical protein [Sedimentisphaerales bacterium]